MDPLATSLAEGAQSSPSPSAGLPLHIPAIPIGAGTASPGTSNYYNGAISGSAPRASVHSEASTGLPSKVPTEPVVIPAVTTSAITSAEGTSEQALSPATAPAPAPNSASPAPSLLSAPAIAPFAALMGGVAEVLAEGPLGEAPMIPESILDAIVRATIDGRTWDFVPALVPGSGGQLSWDLVPALLNNTQATRQSQILAQLLRTAGAAQQADNTYQAAARQLAKVVPQPVPLSDALFLASPCSDSPLVIFCAYFSLLQTAEMN